MAADDLSERYNRIWSLIEKSIETCEDSEALLGQAELILARARESQWRRDHNMVFDEELEEWINAASN